MIPFDPPFRLATASDGPALARLVNFAGEGLPFYFWTGMARDGGDPWEIGRDRQTKRAADGQIVVADRGAGAIAGLTGYEIGPDPGPIDDDIAPLIRPLQELENLAPDSWYVNVLACFPEHRGKGLGSRLLEIADTLGAAALRPARIPRNGPAPLRQGRLANQDRGLGALNEGPLGVSARPAHLPATRGQFPDPRHR